MPTLSDTAIEVRNLAKLYRYGVRHQPNQTLRERINHLALLPFSAARSLASSRSSSRNNGDPALATGKSMQRSTFWALRDVSFDVKRGEVVGIIGRNGAGKSTLLKILSRITEPTSGGVDIYGRVGSLLEVGTGFHPELTGRENIFLNGAILGMRRTELNSRFDEMVAFAEIDEFIDTPVKHYSSGMYLRLAFAVAAHLDSEVLLVDEVLAVGDARFQRKCLDKMEGVKQAGRTVIFVSHNMPAITRICPRTIVLEKGEVSFDGPSHQAVRLYLGSGMDTNAARQWTDSEKAPGNEVVRLRSIRVHTKDGRVCEMVDIREPVGVEMEFDVLSGGHVLVPNYHFINQEGVCVFMAHEINPEWHRRPRPPGRYVSTAWIPGNYLSEGALIIGAAISTMNPIRVHFFERDAIAFQVFDSLDGNSARGDYSGPMPGMVRPLLEWQSQYTPSSASTSGGSAR